MDERDFWDETIDGPGEALPPSLRDLARGYNAPPPPPREAMWARIEAARRTGILSGDDASDTPLAALLGDADVVPIGAGRARRPLRWVTWAAGIAALLTLGVGIGRVWERHAAPAATPVASTGAAQPAPSDDAATAEPQERGEPSAPPRASEQRASEQLATTPRARASVAVRPRGDELAGAATQPSGISPVSTGTGMSAAYRLTLAQHLGQSEAFLTLFRASVRAGRTERLAGATAEQLLATNRLLLDSPAGTNARTRQLLEDLELVLAQIAQLGPQDRSEEIRLITDGLDQSDVLPRIRTVVPAGVGT